MINMYIVYTLCVKYILEYNSYRHFQTTVIYYMFTYPLYTAVDRSQKATTGNLLQK